MSITINFSWLNNLSAGGLLGFSAIILAFIAYRKSVKDKYDSWRSLLESFLDELKAQSSWLATEYHSDHQGKGFYSPYEAVFKISFESAKEIARRGINDLGIISSDLRNNIAIFNERVEAFNALLDYQRNIITANPILSYNLEEFLEDNGLRKGSVNYSVFEQKIEQLKNSGEKEKLEIYALAKEMLWINQAIHRNLIGDRSCPNSLCYLWHSIKTEIEQILENFEDRLPWFVKTKNTILICIFSAILFILVEQVLI